MEDGVTEAESLLYPKEEENHKEGDENHQEGGEDRPNGSLLNKFFSNLASKEETDEARDEGEGEKNEEKGGGILVSPLSQKEEGTNEDRIGVRDGGTSEGEVGEKDKAKEEVELVTVDEEKEKVKTKEEGGGGGAGGGGIIDQIVSHFATAFPDDAGPTTDEASILIHSIIHD